MSEVLDPRCPRLIEVALPVREISAESVRQKSPQRGHISTLHLWWARRPLAAALAIVFGSVLPDPDDPACPREFRSAVERLLKTHIHPLLKHYQRGRTTVRDEDPYFPYGAMEDTLRNRLLMFIARWSQQSLDFEMGRSTKAPDPKELLDDRCLVKWETSAPENLQGREVLRIAEELVRAAHSGESPVVLDPFSGGGAIPLEAGRIGCRPIANDYNPVAYLILRGTCEFPQRFGKPGRRRMVSQEFGRAVESEVEVPNVLVHDVEHWARRILDHARQRISHLYPAGEDGRPVAAYLWARTVPCSNPACQAEMPLLKTLLVCNKSDRRVALSMQIDRERKTITFGIARAKEIIRTEGTMLTKGNVRCPFCEQVSPVASVRTAGCEGRMGEQMVAVVVEESRGKGYRPVESTDLAAFDRARSMKVERPSELIRPEVTTSEERIANRGDITVHLYGMKTWGSLFNSRQLVAMQAFIECLRETLEVMHDEVEDEDYRQAIALYLGLWVSRNAMRVSTVGSWHTTEEKIDKPFEGARLSMKWDYPEANPFSGVSGGFAKQLDLVLRVIARERSAATPANVLRGDGAHLPIPDGTCDVAVTDPPYFDEAAYADLSDFFYVWLKRGLAGEFPENFVTPQVPKADEATALKHRHGGDATAADRHFTRKLAEVFAEARRACRKDGLVSVVFAHQETEAWTALIHSLFASGLTIDATWPIEMEMGNRQRALNSAALQTSITVVCRPRAAGAPASLRQVRREIDATVTESVHRFWNYGFRGADLIVACYGPAVGVFGRYERVERADGTPVTVPELLTIVRQAALKAIAGEFEGDTLSRLYFVWTNLYGISQQSWDDARLVVQMGGDAESALEVARNHGIFVVDGSNCRLALLADRADRRALGMDANPPLIDALHHAMLLWKCENRADLVRYLSTRELLDDGPFWKLAQALFEVLPRDVEDWKIVNALLGERETLRTEAKRTVPVLEPQGLLFAEMK